MVLDEDKPNFAKGRVELLYLGAACDVCAGENAFKIYNWNWSWHATLHYYTRSDVRVHVRMGCK